MKAYIKNSMTISLGFSVAAALLMAGPVYGAQTGVIISSLPPDAVSTAEDGATISDNGSYVTVSFAGHRTDRAPSSPPSGARAGIRTTLSTAEGAFTGDYLAAGAQGLSFELKHTGGTPPRVTVVLEAASGRRWFNSSLVNFADADGEWVESNVSFDLQGGWFDARGNTDPVAWQAALQDVASIGLNIIQSGALSQSVSVDNFRLLLENEVWTPAAVLQDRLFARFGVRDANQLTAAQRALDSSGNGIADWQAIMFTESNPDDALDGLFVNVRRNANGNKEVSWPANAGRVYRVLVSDSPAGPFLALSGAEDIVAAARGRRVHIDSNDEPGPRFYRVVQLK